MQRASMSAIKLLCSGERRWITTQTMPQQGGAAVKNRCRASTLPAEAPRPIIASGNHARGGPSGGAARSSAKPKGVETSILR